VSDGVDPHDGAEIPVGDHERKAGDHALPHLGHWKHRGARRRGVECCDERHGALDPGIEPLATARIVTLVTSGRRVELGARGRC
jgi:hypothetical protein